MSGSPTQKALIGLHSAVLIWGFTAILGRLISYGSLNLVWHRMMLTAAVYLMMRPARRGLRSMSRRHILQFMGIGVIIALHWITFYGSIKIGSSVSLTLGCFGVVSFFTALLEPLLTGKPFRKIELLLGMFVLLGLYFIYKAKPDDEAAAANYMQAIGVGILSAFLASLFSTLNKKYIGTHSTVSMSVLELGSGFLFLSLILPFTDISHFTWIPEGWDILWILLLSVVCTNLAFFLGTDALKHVSAFTANLAVNMEPVYGIVLAALFFKEYQALNAWFYAGAGIILLTVLAHPFLEKLNKRKQTE